MTAVEKLLTTCSKTIRPYAEDILLHTLKINKLPKFKEQENYIEIRIKDLLLTPCEKEILEAALAFKEIELMGNPTAADQKSCRRLMGCTRLSTLKMVVDELGDPSTYSDVLYTCYDTMYAYLEAKQETLTFFDLMRQVSFSNEGVEVQPGTWLK